MRKKVLNDIQQEYLKRAEKLDDKFYKAMRNYLTERLVIDGDVIKNISKNYYTINGIDKDNEFVITNKRFRKWLAQNFAKVLEANNDYFKSSKHKDAVIKQMLLDAGLVRVKGGYEVLRGGKVDNVSDFSEAYTKVRRLAVNAIARGTTLDDFTSRLKTLIKPETKLGPIRSRLATIARDTFYEFDRTTQFTYAQKLGYKAFIYENGLVADSRDFCKERNGKVFTIEETEAWRNMKWDGKRSGEGYEPILHLGDINCRHIASFIPDYLAIKLRPELKELWGV